MPKNAKLTPAMQRVMEIVERHGYVDLIRDGRTLRRTVDAMIERGLLREFGWWRRGAGYRYYPTSTPEQVWDEAHAAQDVREQCGCLRNPLGHSRAEHPVKREYSAQLGGYVVQDASGHWRREPNTAAEMTCPAGTSCTGAAFPGHAAHDVVTTPAEVRTERAICKHDGRPIARRTDRSAAKWHHADERGGRGCAGGQTEATPDVIDGEALATEAWEPAEQPEEVQG